MFAQRVPFWVFELICVGIIVWTLSMMARKRDAKELGLQYLSIAVAAWISEDTCIRFYEFYSYSAVWDLRLDKVPVLVPMIWPLVILSARDVARSLFRTGENTLVFAVFAIVCVDASLVEVISVACGLWSWSAPGHLHVPVIGIVGWGCFGAAVHLCLASSKQALQRALVVAAPILTHAFLVMLWWGFLRWVWRSDLGLASVSTVLVLGACASAYVLHLRRRGRFIAGDVVVPRVGAALLFLGLLIHETIVVRGDGTNIASLWMHAAAVAFPYSLATKLGASQRGSEKDIGG